MFGWIVYRRRSRRAEFVMPALVAIALIVRVVGTAIGPV